MNAKTMLAELYSLRQSSNSGFIKEPIVVELSGRIDIIKKIEPLHLPDVSRLICLSDSLFELQWKTSYADVRRYYQDETDATMIASMIVEKNTSEYFIMNVFPVADKRIIQTFTEIYKRYQQLIDKERTRKHEIEGEIDCRKKKLMQKEVELESALRVMEENKTDGYDIDGSDYKNKKKNIGPIKGVITRTQKEIDERISKIVDVDNDIVTNEEIVKKFESAFCEAKTILSSFDDLISKATKIAYSRVDENTEIDHVIRDWIELKEINPEATRLLSQYNSSTLFLSVLSAQYATICLPLLAALYDNGIIDIFDDPFHEFLVNSPSKVCAYVSALLRSQNQNELDDNEVDNWIKFEIDCAILSQAIHKHIVDYYALWDGLIDLQSCRRLLRILEDRQPNEFANNYAGLLLCSSGQARKALLSLYNELISDEKINGVSSIIQGLLYNKLSGDDCDILIGYFVHEIESAKDRAEREIDKLQSKINRLPNKLFCSIVEPIEELEVLASNIDSSTGNISPSLIATNMKNALTELRGGLSVAGIFPLEEAALWKSGKSVPFDSTKHTISIVTPPQNVYLRTLGFKYLDDEGVYITRLARVGRFQDIKSKKANKSSNMPKTNTKNPQPNRKRQYKRAATSTSKKGGVEKS